MTTVPPRANAHENPSPADGTGHPAAQPLVLLNVREAATWIGERRGRRPSRSTIYTALRDGVRGHRLASTHVAGVLHVAENDLAIFCEARDWPTRPRRPRTATAEKFLQNQMLLPFDWADSSLSPPCGVAAE